MYNLINVSGEIPPPCRIDLNLSGPRKNEKPSETLRFQGFLFIFPAFCKKSSEQDTNTAHSPPLGNGEKERLCHAVSYCDNGRGSRGRDRLPGAEGLGQHAPRGVQEPDDHHARGDPRGGREDQEGAYGRGQGGNPPAAPGCRARHQGAAQRASAGRTQDRAEGGEPGSEAGQGLPQGGRAAQQAGGPGAAGHGARDLDPAAELEAGGDRLPDPRAGPGDPAPQDGGGRTVPHRAPS